MTTDDRQGGGLLTQAELRQVILAATSSKQGTSEEDVLRAVSWAEHARADAVMLSLVLDGKVGIAFKEGKDGPSFWRLGGGG